ncbi:MAG TPA: PepSY domain-containing protein [Rudaea sp.]|nr:PepSY domain-containing protein [Rudaea sp.]
MSRRLAIAIFTALFVAGAAWAGQITLQQAIDKVQHETNGKVLSAETKHYGKHTIYRIKVLTRSGQVRVVEVPAEQAD